MAENTEELEKMVQPEIIQPWEVFCNKNEYSIENKFSDSDASNHYKRQKACRMVNTNKTFFFWKGKKPSVRFKVLQDEKRGLSVLNLYYEAAGLVWISNWIKNSNEKLIKLETADMEEGLQSYLWGENGLTFKKP